MRELPFLHGWKSDGSLNGIRVFGNEQYEVMFQKFKISRASFYSSFFELMLKATRLSGKVYTTQRSGRTLELVKHGQQLTKIIGSGCGRGIAQ